PRPPTSTLFPYTTLFRSQLAEADLIEDLTPYWEQYASDDLKELYAEQGTAVLNSGTVNGKIMGIGKADVYGDGVYLWIRKDWLRSEEHTSELQSRENLVC